MASQFSDRIVCSGVGRIVGKQKQKVIADKTWSFLTLKRRDVYVSKVVSNRNRNRVGDWCLSASTRRNDLFISRRNTSFIVARNQLSSDCEVDSSDMEEESLCLEEDDGVSRDQHWKELPLMETAYIGRLGYSPEHLASMAEMFESWMSKHSKTYRSIEEKLHRFEIFIDNLKYIDETNEKVSSYWLGLNEFADLSHEEFKSKYLGLKVEFPIGGFSYRDVEDLPK